MTAPEFKAQYPHLAHLEGNALWDAMERAVLAQQEPLPALPDDLEIAEVVEYNGYTFSFTKGAGRLFEKLLAPAQGTPKPTMTFGLMVPGTGEFIPMKDKDDSITHIS